MHVIARAALVQAKADHADAANQLDAWWKRASGARWEDLDAVREDYQAADQVGCCLVFNIKGRHYRLICGVTYANQWTRGTLYIKHFLTHAEYNKGRWAEDC